VTIVEPSSELDYSALSTDDSASADEDDDVREISLRSLNITPPPSNASRAAGLSAGGEVARSDGQGQGPMAQREQVAAAVAGPSQPYSSADTKSYIQREISKWDKAYAASIALCSIPELMVPDRGANLSEAQYRWVSVTFSYCSI